MTIAADTMIDAWHKDALSPEHAEQITGRYNALKKYVQDMSVSMQVSQPRLLLQVAVGDMKDNNSAFNSREFTNYIGIEKERFSRAMLTGNEEALTQLQVVIGHEMAHLRHKDTYPVALFARAASYTAEQRSEILADLVGAGPLGSGMPKVDIAYFEEVLHAQVKRNIGVDSGGTPLRSPTAEDYKRVSVGDSQTHPGTMERIAYMERADALMKEYAATHRLDTQQQREAASKWLTETVMKEIQDGVIPESSFSKRLKDTLPARAPEPYASMPPDVVERVGSIQRLPMTAPQDVALVVVTPAAEKKAAVPGIKA